MKLIFILVGIALYPAQRDIHSEHYCVSYCNAYWGNDYYICSMKPVDRARCELVVSNEIKMCVEECERE